MRRVLVIFLLALLPLQFSWAAVAVYCGHETQASAGHLGHHEHRRHAAADHNANPVAELDAATEAQAEKAPGALDPDCGHCQGGFSVVLIIPMLLSRVFSTAPPHTVLDETVGATAPTRPERPKWLPLA